MTLLTPPILQTERLILRGHRLSDFPASFSMWSEPLVTAYIGGKASTEQQAWSRLLHYVGHWSLLGFGYWAIEERATHTFIGEAGFANFKRDIDPEMRDDPEIGWALASKAHGKGFATEAIRSILAWSDEHFASPRTVCLIDIENLPSIHLAQKNGFSEFRQSIYNGRPTIFFERNARKNPPH